MNSADYRDWTGLTSGHKRPVEIERAYSAMLDAWAAYNDACDRWEDGEAISREALTMLRNVAIRKDGEYAQVYDKFNWNQTF